MSRGDFHSIMNIHQHPQCAGTAGQLGAQSLLPEPVFLLPIYLTLNTA